MFKIEIKVLNLRNPHLMHQVRCGVTKLGRDPEADIHIPQVRKTLKVCDSKLYVPAHSE